MKLSPTLEQAQEELLKKRPKREHPVHITEVIKAVFSAPPAPEPEPEREVTSLVSRMIQDGPVSIRTMDASHPKMAHAVNMALKWAERKRDGCQDASLVLCGPNGVGKTHIAKAIWWSITQQPVDRDLSPMGIFRPVCPFFLSNDLIHKMGYARDPETGVVLPVRPSEVIGYPSFLIMDDVGLEQKLPFISADDQEEERHARFFKIINHCYGNVGMIVTSNKTWPELANYIGKRSADRLIQMAPKIVGTGDSFLVDLFGVPSYRHKLSGR